MSGGWDELYGDVEGGAGDVQAVVEEQEAQAELSPAQRRQRVRDARRQKVTIDFKSCPDLEDYVRQICDLENTGISTMVMWLLKFGLSAYQEGARPTKEVARSLKFSYDCEVFTEGLDDF